MNKVKKYVIFFSGEYDGLSFDKEIVGMADTIDDARVLLQSIKDEDQMMLDQTPTGYYIKEQEFFTP